jgi:hypothetical protein
MRLILVLSCLALSACASAYTASSAGKSDNHPAVCQVQSDLAQNGRTDGRPQSISCPAHGIGTRLY